MEKKVKTLKTVAVHSETIYYASWDPTYNLYALVVVEKKADRERTYPYGLYAKDPDQLSIVVEMLTDDD